MRERPILFSDEMVRALLSGRKLQTRRPIKPQPMKHFHYMPLSAELVGIGDPKLGWQTCPFGTPGERLWVRETFATICHAGDAECHCEDDEMVRKYHQHEYRADTGNARPGEWPEAAEYEHQDGPRWTPSIHMPRQASRITLEIIAVRVERVQEISMADAWAEGIARHGITPGGNEGRAVFRDLWDSIYGPNVEHDFAPLSWSQNPWVWVVEFKQI